jgi:hypothetical protein
VVIHVLIDEKNVDGSHRKHLSWRGEWFFSSDQTIIVMEMDKQHTAGNTPVKFKLDILAGRSLLILLPSLWLVSIVSILY